MSGYYSFETSTPRSSYKRSEPYVKYLPKNFDASRPIWGSDFTPTPADVTFEETFIHLDPWISDDDFLKKIWYGNLMKLLRSQKLGSFSKELLNGLADKRRRRLASCLRYLFQLLLERRWNARFDFRGVNRWRRQRGPTNATHK